MAYRSQSGPKELGENGFHLENLKTRDSLHPADHVFLSEPVPPVQCCVARRWLVHPCCCIAQDNRRRAGSRGSAAVLGVVAHSRALLHLERVRRPRRKARRWTFRRRAALRQALVANTPYPSRSAGVGRAFLPRFLRHTLLTHISSDARTESNAKPPA